ncbi:hypothetical protein [Streptomyces sp. NPDC058751]|uniref:hypothetical protein n=1 Tax=Streptomyces sp. NPDC058751 TaxID=3346623 RepID=UPI0036C1A0CD
MRTLTTATTLAALFSSAVLTATPATADTTATGTETVRYTVGDIPQSVALAGGKLWFSYGEAPDGNIGSVDISVEQPVVTLEQEGSIWYNAPVLDAAPGSGTLIAAATGGSPVFMASYDVSSGPLTRTAFAGHDASNLGDLQVTPDGQHVIVASGAPYYHQVIRTSDLTADGSYASDAYPNAVAIAPNGAVAAGISGAYSLRVLEAPTKAATSITVDAPATATRAKQLTVKGKVSSRGALPAGIKLTVPRTDLESPSGKALATRATPPAPAPTPSRSRAPRLP